MHGPAFNDISRNGVITTTEEINIPSLMFPHNNLNFLSDNGNNTSCVIPDRHSD